ncbi:uncharacterized protein EAE97_004428 [Botrytis byssoidea]|uniref:Uncharacterized protein n=1 Tax=Botrytis byssoidea TaxID=139641 RepID=A0A9P5M7M3_9HELO|nr:uncharacterized protein EAE97_004428 [Botrytis byssoidea]KAF7947179.1 hypothetical protein EAE97_004428 [Botrytis byssoidea]
MREQLRELAKTELGYFKGHYHGIHAVSPGLASLEKCHRPCRPAGSRGIATTNEQTQQLTIDEFSTTKYKTQEQYKQKEVGPLRE